MSPELAFQLGQLGLGAGLLWLVAKWAPIYARELTGIRVELAKQNGRIEYLIRGQERILEVVSRENQASA